MLGVSKNLLHCYSYFRCFRKLYTSFNNDNCRCDPLLLRIAAVRERQLTSGLASPPDARQKLPTLKGALTSVNRCPLFHNAMCFEFVLRQSFTTDCSYRGSLGRLAPMYRNLPLQILTAQITPLTIRRLAATRNRQRVRRRRENQRRQLRDAHSAAARAGEDAKSADLDDFDFDSL